MIVLRRRLVNRRKNLRHRDDRWMAISCLVLQLDLLPVIEWLKRKILKVYSYPRHVVVPGVSVLVPDSHHQAQPPLPDILSVDQQLKLSVEIWLQVCLECFCLVVSSLEES